MQHHCLLNLLSSQIVSETLSVIDVVMTGSTSFYWQSMLSPNKAKAFAKLPVYSLFAARKIPSVWN